MGRLPELTRFAYTAVMSNPHRQNWLLDPDISFLNHGSFGATPRVVLEHQQMLRQQMEREPVRFFVRELEPLIDRSREQLAQFVGADPSGLAFVTNATAGVNAVLRSLTLAEGDELLTTDHEYNACRNALEYVAERSGASVVVAEIPFPISSPDVVVERITDLFTDRTRLVLVDYVTSQTGLVFPIEAIIRECASRGVEVMIDGAHAPGMLPLDLRTLGATYFTGNCHKWICAPKGAGFLWVRSDRRDMVRPTSISHGANSMRSDRSRFQLEFDWTGTADVTPWLSVGRAIDFMGSILPGGWPELMENNRAKALASRELLLTKLGIAPPAPDSMIGALAAVPLPDGAALDAATSLYGDPLQDALLERYSIEVPIVPWPAPGRRILRVSAQIYNELSEYERLGDAVLELLGREPD